VSAFTYANVGASCFDCSINFTVDKGNPPWLYGVNLYAVNHGAASPTNVTTPWSQITGLNASGAYTAASFLGLTAGISGGWDIYAAYVDQQGNVSPAALIATTVANPQVVGSTIMAAMPGALKSSGPTISSSSVTSRTTDVGMTQSCLIAFTETDFTAIPSWMDSVLVCTRVHGTTTLSKQISFDPRAVSTGIYTNVPAQAGVGETVDFGLAYQDMTGAISTIVWPSGLSNSSDSDGAIIDPTGPGRPIKYPRTPVAVQNVIDASSNILNVEFPGGKLQANGALTNVDGVSSTTAYPLPAGTTITAQANIAKGGALVSGILIGNTTNGYRIYYAGGSVSLDRYVGGVNTNIGTLVSAADDTNTHTLKITIVVVGASNNLIQASWDGVDPNAATHPGGVVDTSLDLTSGTWHVTLFTGGSTGKVTGYSADTSLDHYLKLAPIVKKRIAGDGTLDISTTPGPISGAISMDTNVTDGSTRTGILVSETAGAAGSRTIKQLNDGTNVRNAAAAATLYDASGNVNGSGPLIKNMPNQVVALADVGVGFAAFATSYTIWLTNLSGSSTPQWIMQDAAQTTYDLASYSGPNYFSITNYMDHEIGLASGWKRWWIVTYAPSSLHNGVFTITRYTSEPSQATKAAAMKDGSFLCVIAPSGTQSAGFINDSSGSGSKSGGGGGKLAPGL
jgi:hypothetical protein